jgi:putative transposase
LHRGRRRSGRRDEDLKVEIARVRAAIYDVYGPRKIWLQLNREGVPVARCTVERLMKDLQLQGVRSGRRVITTRSEMRAARPADLVQGRFRPAAPNRLWVADFHVCLDLFGDVIRIGASSTPTPAASSAGVRR